MGCGLKSWEENCGDDDGTCVCTTDNCNTPVRPENSDVSPGNAADPENAADKPGMTTATYALILIAALSKYIFA